MNRKAGDWNCPACQHLNFSRRDACLRCNEPRPGGGGGGGGGGLGNSSEHGDHQFSSHSSGGGGGRDGYGFGRDHHGDNSYGGGGGGGGARSYGGNFGGFGSNNNNNVGVRPGDWYCPSSGCGAHNFASRNNCFKCGAFKDDGASSLIGAAGGGPGSSAQGYDSMRGGGGRSSSYGFGQSYNAGSGGGGARQGWKSGDWICGRSGCNEHNFASRLECYRCSAPRETGTTM